MPDNSNANAVPVRWAGTKWHKAVPRMLGKAIQLVLISMLPHTSQHCGEQMWPTTAKHRFYTACALLVGYHGSSCAPFWRLACWNKTHLREAGRVRHPQAAASPRARGPAWRHPREASAWTTGRCLHMDQLCYEIPSAHILGQSHNK